jgi:C-terminal processing protease CtpA/Prc
LRGDEAGISSQSSDRLDPVEEVIMRKLSAALVAAILTATPVAAVADKSDPWSHVETFEWMASSEGARLGVMVMSLTPELRSHFGAASDKGVLVAKVEPGSAAAKAGIKVGDVLVDVKGNTVDEASDVIAALSDAKSGDAVKIGLVRDHKQMSLDATIGTTSSAKKEPDWLKRIFPWFRPDRDAPERG